MKSGLKVQEIYKVVTILNVYIHMCYAVIAITAFHSDFDEMQQLTDRVI